LVARILERGKRGRPHARWFPCNGNKETVSEDIEREIGYCLRVRQLEQLIRERPGLTAEEYAQQHPTPKSTIYSMLHFLLLARLIVKAMTDGSRGRPLTRWYPSVNK
jgi:response regulator of citrate/malate metabolism